MEKSLNMAPAHQRLNVKHANKNVTYKLPNPSFAHWLVGVTDGDGCFSFSVNKKRNSIWNCTFKIGQSLYNSRLLYFIKKELGHGSVSTKGGKNMGEFRIRDRKTLLNLIVPLFTKYPLYSTKQFYFLQWVEALKTLENTEYTSPEKDEILTQLKLQTPPFSEEGGPHTEGTYVSPAWEEGQPADEWIFGFTEAEGSFFITRKGARKVAGEDSPSSGGVGLEDRSDPLLETRVVHSFGITQKLDGVIVEFLRKKFHISSKVLYTKRKVYKLETTSSRSIVRIRDFFLNKLKGMKSLEYKIWARSLKHKGDSEKLLKVQDQLRKVRGGNKV